MKNGLRKLVWLRSILLALSALQALAGLLLFLYRGAIEQALSHGSLCLIANTHARLALCVHHSLALGIIAHSLLALCFVALSLLSTRAKRSAQIAITAVLGVFLLGNLLFAFPGTHTAVFPPIRWYEVGNQSFVILLELAALWLLWSAPVCAFFSGTRA